MVQPGRHNAKCAVVAVTLYERVEEGPSCTPPQGVDAFMYPRQPDASSASCATDEAF
jgi:hypothetical protein